MSRMILVVVLVVLLASTGFAQEVDILDFASKNSLGGQEQNPDGSWRSAKFGDYELEQAVGRLEDYPRPYTVPKVSQWYSETKDVKVKASLLRVLAASRDPRAALLLGSALKDDNLDIRIAATYGLMDYFLPSAISGGTEQHLLVVSKWWEKNRSRLEKEAEQISRAKRETQRTSVFIKAKPNPESPWAIAESGGDATIVLTAIFDASGKVTDIKFLKAVPEDLSEDLIKDFVKLCITAAQQIKFTPATKNGRPVSTLVQLEYNFSLVR